ncbi:putative HPT factor 9-like [Homarus americanus]|uniref:Putative HPT factor 9-like n=1 Tax=Homarus americanus TaxID=6706 RepID=A0A8J5JIJ9_HOMAM|nr:putative HPT factor 9-like [Homarus americanus]
MASQVNIVRCVGDPKCNPKCELVKCGYPEDCEYGAVIPECRCCPVCAENPYLPLQQVQQQAGEARTARRKRRSGVVGTATRKAKVHSYKRTGGLSKEFLEKVRLYLLQKKAAEAAKAATKNQ